MFLETRVNVLEADMLYNVINMIFNTLNIDKLNVFEAGMRYNLINMISNTLNIDKLNRTLKLMKDSIR